MIQIPRKRTFQQFVSERTEKVDLPVEKLRESILNELTTLRTTSTVEHKPDATLSVESFKSLAASLKQDTEEMRSIGKAFESAQLTLRGLPVRVSKMCEGGPKFRLSKKMEEILGEEETERFNLWSIGFFGKYPDLVLRVSLADSLHIMTSQAVLDELKRMRQTIYQQGGPL